MINNDILRRLRAMIDVERAKEPDASREHGMLRKLWNAHNMTLPLPPQYAQVDDALCLTPAEARAVCYSTSLAYNEGFARASDLFALQLTDTIVSLAAEGYYLHIQGLWVMAHASGLPIDHEAVAARLLESHGPAVSATYSHEASVGAALMVSGGAPVVLPSSADVVH